MKRLLWTFVAVAATVVVVSTSRAAVVNSIFIDESVEGATPSVTFSSGLSGSISNISVTPVAGVVGEEWAISFSLPGNSEASSLGGNELEPNSTQVSDALVSAGSPTITANGFALTYDLFSDDESGNIASTCVNAFGGCFSSTEDGTFLTMANVSTDVVGSVNIFVKSDVPEPSTLAVLAIGLLGLPWMRRREKRI